MHSSIQFSLNFFGFVPVAFLSENQERVHQGTLIAFENAFIIFHTSSRQLVKSISKIGLLARPSASWGFIKLFAVTFHC